MRRIESDAYSYGVVLLELLTRKKPLDPSFPEGMDILGWVRSSTNSAIYIDDIVDPSLAEETMGTFLTEEVIKVFMVALRCTQAEPRERPTMRDVAKLLTDAKTKDESKSVMHSGEIE